MVAGRGWVAGRRKRQKAPAHRPPARQPWPSQPVRSHAPSHLPDRHPRWGGRLEEGLACIVCVGRLSTVCIDCTYLLYRVGCTACTASAIRASRASLPVSTPLPPTRRLHGETEDPRKSASPQDGHAHGHPASSGPAEGETAVGPSGRKGPANEDANDSMSGRDQMPDVR